MKKLLITGVNGMLGQQCIHEFQADYKIVGVDLHDHAFVSSRLDYHQLDITKRKSVKETISGIRPDFIVNCAAYTNVDGAETERELCWKVNAEAVAHLSYVSGKIDAPIIHISTDYVFDGTSGPYRETDLPSPRGFYGKSKLAGENALRQSDVKHAILRTQVLYGAGVNIGLNFVTWLIRELKNKRSVTIVNDQIGNPTLAADLTAAIRLVIEQKKWDLFHISGAERLDRYQFAVRIADFFNLDKSLIQPITTAELKQAAPRPLASGFILDKAINELNYKPRMITENLQLLKKQLKRLKQW